jgi:hypothetical protein
MEDLIDLAFNDQIEVLHAYHIVPNVQYNESQKELEN